MKKLISIILIVLLTLLILSKYKDGEYMTLIKDKISNMTSSIKNRFNACPRD